MAMVSEDNVVEITRVLVNYALKSDPEFCDEILGSILSTCSRNLYEIVIDFDWYVSLLGEMAMILHCQKREEIEEQLVDIGMRVKDARPELVRVAQSLLIDPALLGNLSLHRILSAAAWLSGEFLEFSRSPFELAEALIQPRTDMLPPSIRAVYLQSVFKVLIFVASSNPDTDLNSVSLDQSSADPGDSSKYEFIINLLNLVESSVTPLLGSREVEVLEGARNIVGLIELVRNKPSIRKQNEDLEFLKVVNLLNDAFSDELGPVSWNAQDRVWLPAVLMLNENLKELDAVLSDIKFPSSTLFSFGVDSCHGEKIDATSSNSRTNEDLETTTESNESTSLLSEHRRRHGLYYLPSEKRANGANDYPPANDPKSEETSTSGAVADDVIKLATQSLISRKKPCYAKSRPVVVKLDEGDDVPVVQKNPESKGDLLSGAVRDFLCASDSKGKDAGRVHSLPKESKENSHSGNSQRLKSSSRKGKHGSHHQKDEDSSNSE